LMLKKVKGIGQDPGARKSQHTDHKTGAKGGKKTEEER